MPEGADAQMQMPPRRAVVLVESIIGNQYICSEMRATILGVLSKTPHRDAGRRGKFQEWDTGLTSGKSAAWCNIKIKLKPFVEKMA